ncbi:MAG: hypothetical protein WD270_11545 [Acetobacterales bacterium]
MTARTAAAFALFAAAVLAGCDERPQQVPMQVAGGDPARGRLLIEGYGCGACHEIPGIPGAGGTVGPPLVAFARQVYIGGVLPNLPDEMVAWLMAPPAVDPRTAMPDLGVTEPHARDIAAYLYEEAE